MWPERTLDAAYWLGITYGLAVLSTGIYLWIRAYPTGRSCFESLLKSTWTVLGFVSIPAGFALAFTLSPRDHPTWWFFCLFVMYGGGLGVALIAGARKQP